MAKKKSQLDAKLGSWADQVNLSRPETPPSRQAYALDRSLIERIATVAAQNKHTPQQLIGHLLTWSLDQVETGQHQVPERSDGSA